MTAQAELTAPVFEVTAACGQISIEPLDPARDAETVGGWLRHPASAFWQMGDLTLDEVRTYFEGVAGDPHQSAWLGRVDGRPTFLVETYDPTHVLLVDVFDAQPGDAGMHLLVAPPGEAPVRGLTSSVMRAVVRFVFEHLGATRVVVEPDAENTRVAAKNDEVGFRVVGDVDLPGKRARLSVLTRDDFRSAHLAPAPMAAAHRALVAKALSEFAHERLVTPEPLADGQYRVTTSAGGVEYRFAARLLELNHWVIEGASIQRLIDGESTDLDGLQVIVELQAALGIPDALLATYLEEVSSTLASSAYKRHAGGPSAAQLVTADFQTIEAAMTEGHPAFVANNGRIGFDLDDFYNYAPEVGAGIRLVWLAARREHTHLALGAGLAEDALFGAELDPGTRDRFTATLEGHGLDPAAYVYFPVHPWQWRHRITITFAADVARRDLVLLGESDDVYQAQQSIRTFFNRSRPDRSYVKTALAIQNMGFLRGLSPAYMRDTPAINDWVYELVRGDATLQRAGFAVLRERASIGYTGDAYHRSAAPSAHRKMVAALWRESPLPLLAEGERLSTMAALLHRDASGRALACELICASGLAPADWVRSYLRAYLLPIVHCLRAHDLAFMPHGENLILVFDGAVPVRAIMKDIGEEIALLAERPVPPALTRSVHPVSDGEKALAVFTDVFDGVLRYLAAILDGDRMLPEREFWALVAECVEQHADEHPDLAWNVDLGAATFDHSCLNRLQLRNTLQMVDLASQSESLMYAGTMVNPIAAAVSRS